MKGKRLVSILLILCMVLTLMPEVSLPVRAASRPDPVYNRESLPEQVIFNAINGSNEDYFKSVMKSSAYNAVAAKRFLKTNTTSDYLTYDTKYTNSGWRFYEWSDFKDTQLARLSDAYDQLKVGMAVTVTNDYHYHTYSIYKCWITSYTDAYLCTQATSTPLYTASGYSKSQSSIRRGNGRFHDLPNYMAAGSNNYGKPLRVEFCGSILGYYNDKGTCKCAGSATGTVVSFYDGVAPMIESVVLKRKLPDGTFEETRNFKKGDDILIDLVCSEPLRFADDSKRGKGDISIGLMVDRSADRLYAYLTSLDGNTLTFSYHVDEDDTKLYTVTGLDLTAAEEGGKALCTTKTKETGIPLAQVYRGKSKMDLMMDTGTVSDRTYEVSKPATAATAVGYTETTSYVTDMAGNALVLTKKDYVPKKDENGEYITKQNGSVEVVEVDVSAVPKVSFYIDCQAPYVAKAVFDVDTNNADVKALLSAEEAAISDRFLGVGDKIALTLYMNEMVEWDAYDADAESAPKVVTNIQIRKGAQRDPENDPYFTLNIGEYSIWTSAKDVGDGIGLGSSRGYVSVLYSYGIWLYDSLYVNDPDGIIRVTGISFGGPGENGLHDDSGNYALSVDNVVSDNDDDSGTMIPVSGQYSLDTTPPAVTSTDPSGDFVAVQNGGVNTLFYVPFRITEETGGSGANNLPGSLVLELPSGGTGAFRYAVTAINETPADDQWSDGSFGSAIEFQQIEAPMYLYVQPLQDAFYNFDSQDQAAVTFTVRDFAGNKVTTAANKLTFSPSGGGVDHLPPAVTAADAVKSYSGSTGGELKVTIRAQDLAGVQKLEYRWVEYTVENDTEPSSWDLLTTYTDFPAEVSQNVYAPVAVNSRFDSFLWVKATDKTGLTTVARVGEYVYDLSAAAYGLEYTGEISSAPQLKVTSLGAEDRLLIVLQGNNGNGEPVYLAKTVTSSTLNADMDQLGDQNAAWHVATCTEDDEGLHFSMGAENDTNYSNGLLAYIRRNLEVGNLRFTVYSGKDGELITKEGYSPAVFSVKNGAGKEEILIRYLPVGYSSVDCTITHVDEGLMRDYDDVDPNWEQGFTPWRVDMPTVNGTLAGYSFTFTLEDKYGWDLANIDWDNSYVLLENSRYTQRRVCGIGKGATQTIVLPELDLSLGGWGTTDYGDVFAFDQRHYTFLYLMLAQHTSPGQYVSIAIKHDGFTGDVHADDTEPGTVEPEFMLFTPYLEELGAGEARTSEAFPAQEISFDKDSVVYIPAEAGAADLTVQVYDVNGQEAWLDLPWSINSNWDSIGGLYSVIAWNTADPGKVTELSYNPTRCLKRAEDGTLTYYYATMDDALAHTDYPGYNEYYAYRYGNRSLVFRVDGKDCVSDMSAYAAEHGIDEGLCRIAYVDVESGKDNVIALQVKYYNGKSSPITYLTVHPVKLEVPGTLSSSPALSGAGIIGAASGEARIIFTPDTGANTAGLTFYCCEGRGWQEGAGTTWYDVRNPQVMEPDGSGSFALTLPDTADLTAENIYHVVYARDTYGNLARIGCLDYGILVDAKAPTATAGAAAAQNGQFTAAYRLTDESFFIGPADGSGSAPCPVTLNLSWDSGYAAAGQSLTVVLEPDAASGDVYTWTAEETNELGITEITAALTQVHGDVNDKNWHYATSDAWLDVTVKGVISPNLTTATDIKLNLLAVDQFGNRMDEPCANTIAGALGVTPAVTDKQYKATGEGTDMALYLTFNTPVRPAESWIKRDITGFETQWHDAFPIWKDGEWDISFTDVFGTQYTQTLTLTDVFGDYGIDLGFSTLDYVTAETGVTITAAADGPNETVAGGTTATANGTYTVTRSAGGETDTLSIHLNNIVSGGPAVTLYFYFEEFSEMFAAGAENQPRGETTAPVVVSYRTDRETSPVGDTTLTFKNGDSDEFTFQYYDVPTDYTYTVSGRLSDYDINIGAPPADYADEEAPSINIVTLWKQRGGGFVQAEAFPGDAAEDEVKAAIERSGVAQSYDFVVNASDYSRWKVLVTAAAPTGITHDSAGDTIPGVEIQGNNVLVTSKVEDDFWIVVVDYASQDTASDQDWFTALKIPCGSYRFDKTPPELFTCTVADGLYSKTVYIRGTDVDDLGKDTGPVAISGAQIVEETATIEGDIYTHKLIFTDNTTEILVTATDSAGNSASVTVHVDGIDVNAPVLFVTWTPCFQDVNTGELDHANPTAGPVNVNVVAHIVSDKPIYNVAAKVDGSELVFDENKVALAAWGSVEYTGERITVRFTEKEASAVLLTVTAPNGKSITRNISLGAGVIDKDPPVVTDGITPLTREGCTVPYAEKHSLTFDEDVFCISSATPRTVYSAAYPYELTLAEGETADLTFVDRAGNLLNYTVLPQGEIDSTRPEVTAELDEGLSVTNSPVPVALTANEAVTLTAADDDVTCGEMTPGTDAEGNPVWTGAVSAARNGTFRVIAADAAGNRTEVFFTVCNIDRTIPMIRFENSIISLRQESEMTALEALLADGVTLWDNVGCRQETLTWYTEEVSLYGTAYHGVHLDTPGIYEIPYTVEDEAGNVGLAIRWLKVIDKNELVLSVDGILTERNGTAAFHTGSHTITVGGLLLEDEPFTLVVAKGMKTAGQMKRVKDLVLVGEDGSVTFDDPGFYTLFITTQSRRTFRTLVYIED